MSYGANIKRQRKAAGMTQEQLAKKCGLATITIGQYERNAREPRSEQLRKIADALNVNLIDLLEKEPADLAGLSDGTISPNDIATEMGIPVDIVLEAIRNPSNVPDEARKKIAAVGDLLTMEFKGPEHKGMRTALEEISVSLALLNDEGQRKAVERVSELTEVPKYRKDND